MKFNKLSLIITSLITLSPVALGLILWNELPAQMAIHFGLSGNADGFGSRAFAVFGPPLIMLLLHWLCIFITLKLDSSNKDQSPKVFNMVLWIIPLISLFVCGMVYSAAYGKAINMYTLIPLLFGILYITIGNYMPKCKPNRTMGIKLCWTFASEANWNATHRLAGKLWVICGIIYIFTAFLPRELFVYMIFGIIAVSVIIPILYSYRFYKTELKDGKTEKISYKKKTIIIILIITAAVLAAVALLLLCGSVNVSFGESALTVESTFYPDHTIEYADITGAEYRKMQSADRLFGFGSITLSLGSYVNDELGNHTRYCHNSTPTCVVVKTNDGVTVISAESEEQTKAIYERIILELEKRVSEGNS